MYNGDHILLYDLGYDNDENSHQVSTNTSTNKKTNVLESTQILDIPRFFQHDLNIIRTIGESIKMGRNA